MRTNGHFPNWIRGFGEGYVPSIANRKRDQGLEEHGKTTEDGLTPTSLHLGFSHYNKLTWRHVNPEKAIHNWRAVCGKTARTVRREGGCNN